MQQAVSDTFVINNSMVLVHRLKLKTHSNDNEKMNLFCLKISFPNVLGFLCSFECIPQRLDNTFYLKFLFLHISGNFARFQYENWSYTLWHKSAILYSTNKNAERSAHDCSVVCSFLWSQTFFS